MNYDTFLNLIRELSKVDMELARCSGIPFDNINPIATEYVKSIPLSERIVAAVPHTYFSLGKSGRLPDETRPYVTSIKHAISIYLREWQYKYAISTKSNRPNARPAGQDRAKYRVSSFYDQKKGGETDHIDNKTFGHINNMVFGFATFDDILSEAIANKFPDVGTVKAFKRNCRLQITEPLLWDEELGPPAPWEKEYIMIINLLNKVYQHLESGFINLRKVAARQLSDNPFDDSKVVDQMNFEETAFGSADSQKKSVIPAFEKLVAAYYSATNVACARIEDYSFKPLFEIAAYVGHLRFWQTPPQLSKQADLVFKTWMNEVADNGQKALDNDHWYTQSINFLLESDRAIQKNLPVKIKNRSLSISRLLNDAKNPEFKKSTFYMGGVHRYTTE